MKDGEMKPNRKTGLAGELASARRRLRTWWRSGQAFHRMFGRFTPYVRKRKGMLSVAAACTVGHMAMTLLEPWPMKLILDNCPNKNVQEREFAIA